MKHRWQFSLRSLLIAVTLIFLSLPLLPFVLLFCLWYATEPTGLLFDAVQWITDRLWPKKPTSEGK